MVQFMIILNPVLEETVVMSKTSYRFFEAFLGVLLAIVAFSVIRYLVTGDKDKKDFISRVEAVENRMIKSVENLTTATNALVESLASVRVWAADHFVSKPEHQSDIEMVEAGIETARANVLGDVKHTHDLLALKITQVEHDLASHARYCRRGEPKPGMPVAFNREGSEA